jgi:GxxExxY protein
MIKKHEEITGKILKAFYTVYGKLGYGFLEKVYAKSMTIELRHLELSVVAEAAVPVYYNGELVGEYYADLVVEEKVIVELKAARILSAEYESQLLNYLKATRYEVGMLLNFGPRPDTRRKIFDNERKGDFSWIEPSSSHNP